MKAKKFYGFEYKSGRWTTSGLPNQKTGRMSIAGRLLVFSDRDSRSRWVCASPITADMRGPNREAVTAKEARSVSTGMSISEYNDMIKRSINQ